MLSGLIIAAVVIAADQLSKFWVLNHLLGEQAVIVYTPFFNVVRAWNTGVSFSMFNNYGNLGAILLSVIAGVIVVFLVYWLYQEKDKLAQVALGMIIGGAVGNVIDRIRLGAVFDFLTFTSAKATGRLFNVADSFICIGATILIMQSLFNVVKKNEVK